MSREQRITEILDRMKSQGYKAGGVKRIMYTGCDYDIALGFIEALGKERTPKFTIDNENRWTYTQLIKWVYADPTMQALDPITMKPCPGRLDAGIYIAGNTGTGKSWALELLAEFTRYDQVEVEIGDDMKRLWWRGIRAEDIWEECSTKDDIICEYKNRSILCIQDLGSEPSSEAVRMGTRREPLRQILESRGDRTDRITLITSNFAIFDDEIKQRYTDRVQSRLAEMCNFLVIPGKDRRTI